MTTTAVFLAAPEELAALGAGDRFVLTGEEARHALTVRRLRPGEIVDLVDGRGRRVHARIVEAARTELTVTVAGVTVERPPTVRLVLVQALAKGSRDEAAVEAATEVGADAVIPWQADRSVPVWDGAKAAKGRERWQAVAAAAAKQARRAFVPVVADPVDTPALAAHVSDVVAAEGAVLVLHEGAAAPVGQAVLPQPGRVVVHPEHASTPARVLVVVGPEGGIADREVERLEAAGAQAVRLGPHVMRTSTAGPVALALLAERLGRWA